MRKREWSAIVAMLALTSMAACSGGDAADDSAADTTPAVTPAPAPAPAPTATAGTPPAGATAEMVTAGQGTFTTVCVACHGPDAKGLPNLGPDLTDPEWLNTDGTYDGIINTVKTGVATPKKSATVMPPMGGAALTDDQVKAVAAYVWSLGAGK